MMRHIKRVISICLSESLGAGRFRVVAIVVSEKKGRKRGLIDAY